MRKFFTKKLFKNIVIATFVMGVFLSPVLVSAQFIPIGPITTVIGAAANAGEVAKDGLYGAIVTAFEQIIKNYLAFFANLALTISSFVLWLAGLLLSAVMKYTIVEMSTNIGKITTLNSAWTAFRDLANMFFIFIILYVAIGNILNLSGIQVKKTLVNVVIVALLMNFSLFFTKMLIDASNLVTVSFYNQIVSPPGKNSSEISGIGGAFMQRMMLTGIYDPSALLGTSPGGGPVAKGETWEQIVSIGLMGSIFILIAAFIFLAFCLMFIARYVVLIFLMILSPLAFIAIAMPKDKYSSKWWDSLFSQLIFAPACIALVWVSLTVLGGVLSVPEGDQGAATFAGVFTGKPDGIQIVINFIIVIAMLIFSLIVAKQFGAYGAGKAMSMLKDAGNKARGWAGRGAVRATGLAAVDRRFAETEFGKSKLGRNIRGFTTGALTNIKMADGQSVQKVDKENKKLNDEYGKAVAKNVTSAAEKTAKKEREGRHEEIIKENGKLDMSQLGLNYAEQERTEALRNLKQHIETNGGDSSDVGAIEKLEKDLSDTHQKWIDVGKSNKPEKEKAEERSGYEKTMKDIKIKIASQEKNLNEKTSGDPEAQKLKDELREKRSAVSGIRVDQTKMTREAETLRRQIDSDAKLTDEEKDRILKPALKKRAGEIDGRDILNRVVTALKPKIEKLNFGQKEGIGSVILDMAQFRDWRAASKTLREQAKTGKDSGSEVEKVKKAIKESGIMGDSGGDDAEEKPKDGAK